jgi:outer membrane protein assembly factor BamB
MCQLLSLHIVSSVLLVASTASAGDWPQWRGPDGDNVSKERDWSAVGQEQPSWTAQIGTGYSSPAIAGGRVIVVGYFDREETPGLGTDRVSCLDAASGELLWIRRYAALIYANEHAGGTLSSPTIAGDTVYVATRSDELRALALETGEVHWKIDLVERHGVDPSRYGFASSPFVDGERLILNAGRTLAIDRATGATLWISEDYEARYSTVVPIHLAERACFAAVRQRRSTESGPIRHDSPATAGQRRPARESCRTGPDSVR